MPAKKPRIRKSVKASVLVDARTHSLWAAASALAGMDRSAFAVEAIRAACQGLILIDRRKPADRGKMEDRPEGGGDVNLDGPDRAA